VGACSAETGTTHELLRLPVGLTRGLDQLVNNQDSLANALVADPSFVDTGNAQNSEVARRVREEQRAALAWSSTQHSPLYFGPCDQVDTIVRQVYGDSVRSVTVNGFNEQVANVQPAQPKENEPVAVAAPVVSQPEPVESATAQPSSSYNSAGVAHDSSCGGDYVLGSVYNSAGELVQGVAVVYNDDAGNRNVAAAVNGAYRFPVIGADSPHTIYVSLLDATGNSVSGTVSVPHHQGGGSDLGCHYVIWQGVN